MAHISLRGFIFSIFQVISGTNMSLFVFLIIGAGIGVLGMPNTEVSIRKNSLVRSSVDVSITKTREGVKTSEIAKVKNFKSSHVISYIYGMLQKGKL